MPARVPRDRPRLAVRLDRLDAGTDEHLGALAPRRVEQHLRPRPARAGASDGHQPAASHPVLEAGDRRVERQSVVLEPRPRRLELVDEDSLQAGIAARDPLPGELIGRRRPDQAAAERHRAADRGLALEDEDVTARLGGCEPGREPGHAAAHDDHFAGIAHRALLSTMLPVLNRTEFVSVGRVVVNHETRPHVVGAGKLSAGVRATMYRYMRPSSSSFATARKVPMRSPLSS